MSGERGYVTKCTYFSERRVADAVQALGVDPKGGGASWTVKLSLPFGIGGVERARKRAEPGRDEVVTKIMRAAGDRAVSNFWTPPMVEYARGIGRMQFVVFAGPKGERPLFHTRVVRDYGYRTDLVLFGSMDNTAGYVSHAPLFESGWTSSAMWSIEEFLRTRTNTWDDPGMGD